MFLLFASHTHFWSGRTLLKTQMSVLFTQVIEFRTRVFKLWTRGMYFFKGLSCVLNSGTRGFNSVILVLKEVCRGLNTVLLVLNLIVWVLKGRGVLNKGEGVLRKYPSPRFYYSASSSGSLSSVLVRLNGRSTDFTKKITVHELHEFSLIKRLHELM